MINVNVRIACLTLENFMNVGWGEICSSSYTEKSPFLSSDMMGIYGQNGSGKTALIHAVRILKYCLEGMPLPSYMDEFIQKGKEKSNFQFSFLMEKEQKRYRAEYHFSIQRVCQDFPGEGLHHPFRITDEKLYCKIGNKRKKLLIGYDKNEKLVSLRPRALQKSVEKSNENSQIDLTVEEGISRVQGKSFLFSAELMKFLRATYSVMEEGEIFKDIIEGLIEYGHRKLHVFGNQEDGIINLSIGLPMTIHSKRHWGDILVPVNAQSQGGVLIPEILFQTVQKMIPKINRVLNAMIPDVNIKFEELGRELNKKGEKMVRGELISLRGDQKIPIRYESEGIKKIICILPIFIGAFSDPSMTIAVDELDADIFEYLLGEILRVFQDYGKGQLLFTSHNMRPLELLNQQFIIFTTINPENRYIQIKRIKRSNNLRDVYYRDIQLGGEKETLYQETSRNALTFALEEAEEDG